MASLPTGIDLPNPPSTVATNPPPATVPAFWNDPQMVLERVLNIAAFDGESAGQIWREYKRLTGR